MKKLILLVTIVLAGISVTYAQNWADLNDEQKLMKLKSFRAENQKYLKNTLGMTQTQMNDIDNVNLCFLSTLDRIDRYAKSEEDKDKYAEVLWEARWAQIDAIMGKEKHKQYAEYIKARIEQAKTKVN